MEVRAPVGTEGMCTVQRGNAHDSRWPSIGRRSDGREPIRAGRVDGLLPSRHCYKCTNPVYTPVIIGPRSGVDLSEGNVISGFEGLERLERYDLAWQS